MPETCGLTLRRTTARRAIIATRAVLNAMLHDGQQAAAEGGAALIDDGRKKLSRLANEIDTKTMREPAFRMIIVAEGDYAYEEPDGTLICPIGCLKP